MAAPRRLAVDRQDGPLHARLGDRLVAQRPQPAGECGPEGVRLQDHEGASEDVLAGDAVGQVEGLEEEPFLQGRPACPREVYTKTARGGNPTVYRNCL
jgi:hypothetical protein